MHAKNYLPWILASVYQRLFRQLIHLTICRNQISLIAMFLISFKLSLYWQNEYRQESGCGESQTTPTGSGGVVAN